MNPNQSTGEVSVGGGAWKRVLVLMLFSLLVLAMLQSAIAATNRRANRLIGTRAKTAERPGTKRWLTN